MFQSFSMCSSFFFNDTATTEIYTLSLHDALPICLWSKAPAAWLPWPHPPPCGRRRSEEHTSELQSHSDIVCRLMLEKKKNVLATRLVVALTAIPVIVFAGSAIAGGNLVFSHVLCAAVVATLLGYFFFNDTATTEIYTLSLHDALPICAAPFVADHRAPTAGARRSSRWADRKSTCLNSSHTVISYAVFCLKKKKRRLLNPCTCKKKKNNLVNNKNI